MLDRSIQAVASAGLMLFIAACGEVTPPAEPSALGSRCSKASDCASGVCNLSGDFPGGVCTKDCDSTADCPTNFTCISNSSGICLQTCSAEADCAAYGSAWTCREQSLEDGKEQASGKARVCSGR